VNVLKPHMQSTVFTLLERNKSQRKIERLTGIVRKTIRRHQASFDGGVRLAYVSCWTTATVMDCRSNPFARGT
jgi:hypothetical protein